MNRNEALQKIKKCLALAASSNQHEAAAALRQAQKLMAAHQLSEQDLGLADVAEAAARAHHADLVRWETLLAHMVAGAFGCEVLTDVRLLLSRWPAVRRQRSYVFVGVGSAAEVASYAYDVLCRQCAKDRRAHISAQPKNCKPKTKTARGDLYAEGWCEGVRAKLGEFAGNPRDTELVRQYMQARPGIVGRAAAKDRVSGKNVSGDDWHRGVRAGRQARLNRGVGAPATPALLK
ncbi:MAG: DUF2786 domain-containing protein [Pseudomonadota bacterium]|nr:DUF2786 domain-containing protein [Pseudomonadota bacterium]